MACFHTTSLYKNWVNCTRKSCRNKAYEEKIGYRGRKSEESPVFIGKVNAPLLEPLKFGSGNLTGKNMA